MTAADRSHHSTSRAPVLAALTANVGVASAKLVGFLVTGSGAMLAEAIHSGADTGNQLVLLGSMRRAARPADATHPFGYTTFRFAGAFMVAVVLFGLGATLSLVDGIDKLLHPTRLGSLSVDLVIVGVAVVLEALSLRSAVNTAAGARGEQRWWPFLRETRQPELAVLLVEDTSALIGLALAAVAIGLSAATGSPVYDACGSVGIGLVLGVNSMLLGRQMLSLMVGKSASEEQVATIGEQMLATTGITRVVHLRTVHLGPDDLLIGAKVVFDQGMSAETAAEVVDRAEMAIRRVVPSARWIYVEPGRPTERSGPGAATAGKTPNRSAAGTGREKR